MSIIRLANCLVFLGCLALVGSSGAVAADSDVLITEIHYNVHPGNAGGEFLEITNNGLAAVDIGDWIVDQAVSFVFPSGTTLSPGESLILASNAKAAAAFYGVRIFGEYNRRLPNSGGTIVLKSASLTIIDRVTYDDISPWPTEADGGGPSLELMGPVLEFVGPALDNNDSRSWGIGQPYSPGQANSPVSGGAVGDVVISEIMYKPRRSEDREKFDRVNRGRYKEEGDDESGEYVEIVNVTSRTINLVGWAFTDGIDYTFGNVSIAAGEILLIAVDPAAMQERTGQRALGPFRGTLGNEGERLTLRDSSASLVDTVRYADTPPWPVAPDQFGFSLEVIDPSGDNSTAANWRASRASFPGGTTSRGAQVFIEAGDTWRYKKGTSPFPSGWTTVGFGDDDWLMGRTGIGYGDDDDRTVLADMQRSYLSFAARKAFRVSKSRYDQVGQLILEMDYDDAFVAYLNGVEIARSELLAGVRSPVPYNAPIPNPGRESGFVESFSVNRSRLRHGSGSGGNNVLAIQLHNRPESTDASMIARLVSRRGSGGGMLRHLVGGGTPGARNSVNGDGLPPFVASLQHEPLQPTSSQSVQITAFIKSEAPVTSAQILYSTDVLTSFTAVTMFDDGAHGDGAAGDGFWGGEIPGQPSPTFVNYRVRATDSSGSTTIYPYDDEPSETQAYLSFNKDISTTLPIYHLYIDRQGESRLARKPYDDHYVNAHLAIDGVAYPNIDVRLRGRGSRQSPKRQWKFRFNRHQLYKGNRTLDTALNRPFSQWFSFAMFDRAGIANLSHDLIRVYKNGRFFGVYVMFESPNSSWVQKEGLPPSTEVYKARTAETSNPKKNSDLFANQIHTDLDFWGVWNKKLRPLERPSHIREFTFNLNNMTDRELLPWLDQNVNLDEWFQRWIINLLIGEPDCNTHNFYAIRPGDGGKWSILGYDFDSSGGGLPPFYGTGEWGDPNQKNKLYYRVTRNRTLRRMWTLELRQILYGYWDLDEIFAFLDTNFSRVAEDRALDVGRWRSHWDNGMAGVKSVLSSQRSSLHLWLNRQPLPSFSTMPVISAATDVLSGPVSVSISGSSGWHRYYTVDGSDPRLSTTRQRYSTPFLVNGPTVVRAAAISGGLEAGDWTDLAEATFGSSANALRVIADRRSAADALVAVNQPPVSQKPVLPKFVARERASSERVASSRQTPRRAPPRRVASRRTAPRRAAPRRAAPRRAAPRRAAPRRAAPRRANQSRANQSRKPATGSDKARVVQNRPSGVRSVRVRTTRNRALKIRLTCRATGPCRYTMSSPGHGRLSGEPPNVTYTPNAGFVGQDSFTYSVNEGPAELRVTTVSIRVR